MFKHETDNLIAAGKPVYRAGWPAGDHLVGGAALGELALSDKQAKTLGLKKGSKLQTREESLVYVTSEGVAQIGYILTGEDKTCSDWHEFTGAKSEED